MCTAICDFSLQNSKSRPAIVGEKLTTYNFNGGTRGFAPAGTDPAFPREAEAVCLLPGTELSFATPVRAHVTVNGRDPKVELPTVARFTQVNKDHARAHHDCLEFADGSQVLLTFLYEGQTATVLQLPAQPKNEAEAQEQKRVEYAG